MAQVFKFIAGAARGMRDGHDNMRPMEKGRPEGRGGNVPRPTPSYGCIMTIRELQPERRQVSDLDYLYTEIHDGKWRSNGG